MKNLISLAIMKPSILVGGQAVIEGIMMRVPGAYATAVRDPKGNIQIERNNFQSQTEKSATWKLPILRGMMALYESLKMGMKTLQWSADIALIDEDEKEKPGKITSILSTIVAITFALLLFMVGPYWITTNLFQVEKEALAFNLFAGIIRITFFIFYLLAISLIKDVKRLFQYHGAEHRVVYNFESGKRVKIKTAQSFPTQHPRCGTSFMFIVLISAIIFFTVVDTALIAAIGDINLIIRLIVHLALIPVVMGISYEVIKITARHGDNWFFKLMRAPGLWLQLITTKQPTDDMVEVGITALKSAFGDKYDEMSGKEYIAEAVG
ncbi:DUF1385 domain-containing protein [Candidatus Neomarinimicrobiota bacterium]